MRKKCRARELGLNLPGTPGPDNAITDVPDVLVGYTTLQELSSQGTPIQTGVTAILPQGRNPIPQPTLAGQFTLNGNGEMTGTHWIHDGGYFVGPICITNTHSVGAVHQGATHWMLNQYRDAFSEHHLWAMPVVAETYDGVLNDINGQHIRPEHAVAAIDSASSGMIEEGNVGGGTGMICYEYKGGTGTASRRLNVGDHDYTVGCLVQANHGMRDWLTILGKPVGLTMRDNLLFPRENGSIIVILATDAPLSPIALRHLARRASIGVGRHGTPGGNNSGDIFMAFSTANKQPIPQLATPIQSYEFMNSEFLDPIYLAAVESVEESVINALLAAQNVPTFKPSGTMCHAIDHDLLCEALGI
ncbi:MAG: P1 family peptidase [Granulosicoccus sp.]